MKPNRITHIRAAIARFTRRLAERRRALRAASTESLGDLIRGVTL